MAASFPESEGTLYQVADRIAEIEGLLVTYPLELRSTLEGYAASKLLAFFRGEPLTDDTFTQIQYLLGIGSIFLSFDSNPRQLAEKLAIVVGLLRYYVVKRFPGEFTGDLTVRVEKTSLIFRDLAWKAEHLQLLERRYLRLCMEAFPEDLQDASTLVRFLHSRRVSSDEMERIGRPAHSPLEQMFPEQMVVIGAVLGWRLIKPSLENWNFILGPDYLGSLLDKNIAFLIDLTEQCQRTSGAFSTVQRAVREYYWGEEGPGYQKAAEDYYRLEGQW